MRAQIILLKMADELASSIRDMPLDDAEKLIKLNDRCFRLMRKGDEGLLELFDWLDNNVDTGGLRAPLLLFDYLGIEQ